MDQSSKWKVIYAKKFKRQLPLDIEHCSPIALRTIILDVRTSAGILDQIAQVYCDDEEVLQALVRCPNLEETTLAFIALTASEEMKHFIAGTRVIDIVMGEASGGEHTEDGTKLNIQQLIQKMTPPQKIKLAVAGGKDARSLLIRESSKMIAMAVLENPRITIGEIEFFAKSTNLSEDVIRKIGTNSEWSKKISVASALVNNPKTPVGISLGFINRLSDRELGILEKSRNVPAPVRTAAKNHLAKKKLGKA
ncbi:MAG TPA: hypothetical protein VL122_12545 [Nitrospirota bacterium]|nr:hypothetical protein [Nitrospirota bacterium]